MSYTIAKNNDIFDWVLYISLYDDLKHFKNYDQAYYHWINYGINENRICSKKILDDMKSYKSFDWEFYVSYYSDLKHLTSYDKAFDHWIHHGIKENRFGSKKLIT